MKIYIFFVMLFGMFPNLCAAQTETVVQLETETGVLEGSLLIPRETDSIPVALIIAGSGPTDRNGNQPALQNNSLKMLATRLACNGIASLRYDKRGIGKSIQAGGREQDLRFEHYISDARGWINWLRKDQRFNEITVIGHSEGSLLGMIASQQNHADKFVSIAGPGLSADECLREQLRSQPPEVWKTALPIIEKLKQGKTVTEVNPMFHSLFRLSVQPYLISWFTYDPVKEIAKLKIPVLVIQGSADIQVSQKDARLLAKANLNSDMKIIKSMNHIFKKVGPDRIKNIASYNQPDLPIMPELIDNVTNFIKEKKDKPVKTAAEVGE